MKVLLLLILFSLSNTIFAIDRNINVYIEGSVQCNDGSSVSIPFDFITIIHKSNDSTIYVKPLLGSKMFEQFLRSRLAATATNPKTCNVTLAEVYSGEIVHIKQEMKNAVRSN